MFFDINWIILDFNSVIYYAPSIRYGIVEAMDISKWVKILAMYHGFVGWSHPILIEKNQQQRRKQDQAGTTEGSWVVVGDIILTVFIIMNHVV